ncbi:MAG: acyltransferase family protein [Leucobacter sp.]
MSPEAGSAAVRPATTQPIRHRVAFWDNSRFILLVLVVVGHTISTVRTDSELGFALYAYIYIFHMPALILLSGVFSKREVSPKAIHSTVQLLATWLLWEGIWALIRYVVDDKDLSSGFLVSPAWTLWFLVSLATMRILLPYLARLRHPLMVSIGLALLAGLSPSIGTDFSASRTLCFLPFFVLGWMAREHGWLEQPWFTAPTARVKAAAWGLLAAVAGAFVVWHGVGDHWRIDRWVGWKEGYESIMERAPIGSFDPSEPWAILLTGATVRVLLLVLAALMTLAVILVSPRGTSLITTWGTRTLYVYLLHGPIVWTLRHTGVVDAIDAWGTVGMLTLVAMGVAIAVVLSTEIVTKIFRPIIEPPLDWMFRRDDS